MKRILVILAVLFAFPASANAATYYLSPTGSDANSCTQTAPCKTMARGYAVASRNDDVKMFAGDYGSQSISGTKTTGTARVRFSPVTGAVVNVSGELRVHGSNHVRFSNLHFGDWYLETNTSDVLFSNDTAKFFFVRSANHITVQGGSVGGVQDGISPTIGSTYQSTVPSTNVTINGVVFHDIGRLNNPTAHVECLFVQDSDYVTVENSSFSRCDVFDMYVHRIGLGDDPHHMTVTGNTFNQTTSGGFYAVSWRVDSGETLSNVVVNGNVWGQHAVLESQGTVQNFRWCDAPSDLVFNGSSAGVVYGGC